MGDGVLNPLEKPEALELIRNFVPTIRRFEAAVSILFDPERMRSLLERSGIRAREDLEPCDELENMRGVVLSGEHGSLEFCLSDPLLFLDPKTASEVWEEGLDIPLAEGPRIELTSELFDGGFLVGILYDLRRNKWKLIAEYSGRDLAHEHDAKLPDEVNASYAKKAERLNEQFKRLEIPPDALRPRGQFFQDGCLEYEAAIDESRVRTLIPIFYDICDAYFDFDLDE
ncbi:hypothetical protein IT407_04800 [Candidatus Uhrbacteria bacterium]|nr:hypothetical protein [Candidatus Uhrbacteria bacterium]